MNAIETFGLEYAYSDGISALESLDMKISEGKCTVILGPNGAGKSTLLRLISGLLFPSSGSINIKKVKMTRKNADNLRKSIGMVFQDPDDQIFMPRVWEDVAFGPINLGMDREQVEKRVREALAVIGLKGYEDRIPHHLSYGEKKRVALAGVLAMQPDILILDEPTANLDPSGRKQLIDFIKSLDCTVIMTTHDIEAAASLADHVYVLHKKILASGNPREILTDRELLSSAGLEPPEIASLFLKLKDRGMKVGQIPLNIQEAMNLLADFE